MDNSIFLPEVSKRSLSPCSMPSLDHVAKPIDPDKLFEIFLKWLGK